MRLRARLEQQVQQGHSPVTRITMTTHARYGQVPNLSGAFGVDVHVETAQGRPGRDLDRASSRHPTLQETRQQHAPTVPLKRPCVINGAARHQEQTRRCKTDCRQRPLGDLESLLYVYKTLHIASERGMHMYI